MESVSTTKDCNYFKPAKYTGTKYCAITIQYKIKKLDDEQASQLIKDPSIKLSLMSNLNAIRCLQNTIGDIEAVVLQQVRVRQEFKKLLTFSGMGEMLGLRIMLESGDMNRFKKSAIFILWQLCKK